MTRRLLLSYLTVAVVVLVLLEVPLGIFYAQRERERVTAGLEHDASVLATIYEDALEAGSELDPTPTEEYERRTGARVVVTDAAGVSRVDTGGAVPRDFSTRPEIIRALSGGRATGTRRSETLGTELQYVALPVASGGQVHGSVRLTLDVADVNERIQRLWLALAGMAVMVLAVVALVGWVIARSVTSPLRRLNAAATRFADGDLRTGELPGTGPPELRELAATMTAMAARLDALLTSQRAFVADASHQLRTPLTALRLRLENVESGLDEPAADEVAAAIEETRRLADLVNQLLLLARVDERPVLEPTDVGALARDRVDTWGAVAQGSEVTLRLDAPGPVRPALAVRGAVEQVLDNLIDNALAVAPAGTAVTITVLDTADAVELTVSDQGPGLPDDQKADALRRFWRGDTSTPGTGLGLAIVDRLIAASGGSLRLTDAPGGGLRVVVRLPTAGPRPTVLDQTVKRVS